jgi:Protein of unknown function (DUF1579)
MKLVTLALLTSFCFTLMAAAQMEMPKPAPELKKIDMFAGTWKLEGTMKPSPFGPGGKMTEDEKCSWMEGGFYLVCNADYRMTSMPSGKGLSVMGYSPESKMYTYREFNSAGEFEDSKGTVEGDTWTWTNESNVGGTNMKGRFIMKITSPTAYDFKFDMSQDGSTWNNVMEGKATKTK